MKRLYRNPPIIEAVCEIHFDLPHPLTEEQILLMKPLWKPSLPNMQLAKQKGVELKVGLEGVEVIPQESHEQRLVARAEDGNRLAQLSNRFLAVNQLKPYPGWDQGFSEHIHTRLDEVCKHLPIERVREINLRYIDRLDFPQTPLHWSEWFTFHVPVPASIPSDGGSLQFHYDQKLTADLQLALHLVSVQPEREGHSSIIYDATIFWRGSASVGDCAGLLEMVHELHPHIFDNFLTPQSQDLFGAYDV